MPKHRPHVGERDQIHDGWDCERSGQGARQFGRGKVVLQFAPAMYAFGLIADIGILRGQATFGAELFGTLLGRRN
jgi:hypothetical protein